MLRYIFLLLAIAVSANESHETPRLGSGFYFGDIKFMFSVYTECAKKDLSSCLKIKLLTAMDRANKLFPNVNLIHGVSFVKRDDVEDVHQKTPSEIEGSLPRSFAARDAALNNMIYDKIGHFFESHLLQVQFPSTAELRRSFTGRQDPLPVPEMPEVDGDMKSGNGMLLLLPILVASVVGPMWLGGIALLAGKALILAKLALVLSVIVGLKKLTSSGHGHSTRTISKDSHEDNRRVSYDWGRDYQSNSHNLAYNSYARSNL